ncbi:MAG: hypothetical protein HY306_12545 [Nitrosomonadales bacterium]|nr:hypothetical protein [Nitrosomonadales bacterium]
MKTICAFFLCLALSVHAMAGTPAPSLTNPAMVPHNQNLAALAYFGRLGPTGCGVRITGETEDDLWINVVLNVFMRETKEPTAMFKVVVRKVLKKDGIPLLQDGRAVFANLGSIRKAWLETGAGNRLQPATGGEALHGDGYMTSLDFGQAMNLLSEITQAEFRIGFHRGENEADTVFAFNQRMSQTEADTLTSCMKGLREAMEAQKHRNNL